MRLPRCAGLLAALAVAMAKGADTGAPLESTRQELRKLEGDQKTKSGPAVTEGLRTDTSDFQLSEEALLPANLKAFEKEEKKRKKREGADKNWLINGVEKLEQEDKDKQLSHPAEQKVEQTGPRDAPPPASADPGYLLKLYDEQKKTSDTKAEAKSATVAQVDPFAPFLQGWLGSSPARGQFFDEFVKKSDGNSAQGVAPVGGSAGATANREPGAATVLVTDRPRESATAKPNPYLVEQNPVALKELSRESAPLPSVFNPAASLNQPAGSPLSPQLDPLPGSEQPSRKPSLPVLSDDQKYFPQLKKF